jgi:Arc/MetJ-type ribon-helix-helix transcriptional regulator
MLPKTDAVRIKSLKKRLGLRTRAEVIRIALDLLERDTETKERAARWQTAAGLVENESRKVSRDFRPYSRLWRLG